MKLNNKQKSLTPILTSQISKYFISSIFISVKKIKHHKCGVLVAGAGFELATFGL